MKTVLVILTQPNLTSLQVNESLSATMVLATFGISVKVLLKDAALSLLNNKLEFDQFKQAFKKDEKVNLMHIAICRLLEPYGYYEFEYFDNEGWPHYKVKEELPPLKAGEQAVLMKEAIVSYFLEKELIE